MIITTNVEFGFEHSSESTLNQKFCGSHTFLSNCIALKSAWLSLVNQQLVFHCRAVQNFCTIVIMVNSSSDMLSLRLLSLCCFSPPAGERQPLYSAATRRHTLGDLPIHYKSYRALASRLSKRRGSLGENYANIMADTLPPITEYVEHSKEHEGQYKVFIIFGAIVLKVM